MSREELIEELRQLFLELTRVLPPGRYLLAEMVGDAWDALPHKSAIGMWFRRAVDAGWFPGIERCGRTARNHQVYQLGG
jgi:hypothetical protein